MTLYRWSQTAASNATADASINWQEGQAPSSVNDSARAMMASAAAWTKAGKSSVGFIGCRVQCKIGVSRFTNTNYQRPLPGA